MQRVEQSLSQLAGLRNWALWKSVSWGLLSESIPKLNGYSGHITRVFTRSKKTITLVHSSLLPAFFLSSGNQLSCSISSSQSHQTMGGGEETPCCIGKGLQQVHLVPSLEFSLNLWFLVVYAIFLCLLSCISPVFILYNLCTFCTINPAIVTKLLAWLRSRMMVKVKEQLTATPQVCSPRQCSPNVNFMELSCPAAHLSMMPHSKETHLITKKN